MTHKEQAIAAKLLRLWSRVNLNSRKQLQDLQNLTTVWQSLEWDSTPDARAMLIDYLLKALIQMEVTYD